MKKKKYTHKIVFENQSKEVELVEKNKQRILKTLQILMDSSFDFDLTLHIWIRDEWPYKNDKDDGVDTAFSTKKGKEYIICLMIDVLKSIEYDNGLELERAIFHELAHIYDLYLVINNKYHKFNPTKTTQRTQADYIRSRGWRFWTEFFAYYHTFKNFYHYTNFPTFLDLVKSYEKLRKGIENIKYLYRTNATDRDDKGNLFLEEIDAFVYDLAKFLAGQLFGKTKYIKYCEKTKENESFKYIEKLCDGFMSHIAKLLTNTHGKGMIKKLYNIGNYIYKKIYNKLSFWVGIIDNKARVYVWLD